MIKSYHLSEEDLILYYNKHNLDILLLYCKDCGKLLVYDNSYVYYAVNKDNTYDYNKLMGFGHTFLKTRIYNNSEYHLCRCKDCVSKKYPNILKHKFLYAQKGSFSTKYAFDVSDEDFSIVSKLCNGRTKENMIAKYGDAEGNVRWNEYITKLAISNTFEYKHKKYGMTIEEFLQYNKSRAVTLNNLISRYGDIEGHKKWQKYCDRQRYTNSLEYFVSKYGEDKGFKKYMWFDKSRTSFAGASNMANECFDYIYELCKSDEVYYDKLNYEYSIDGYRVDFYNKTKNIVIEFYGDVFHCNPLMYKETDSAPNIFNPDEKQLVKDIWNKDKIRLNYIVNKLNCKFIIIWEHDYKNNFKNIINDIKIAFSRFNRSGHFNLS